MKAFQCGLILLGFLAALPAVAQQDTPYVPQFVDANGEVIGTVLDPNYAVLKIKGTAFRIRLEQYGFRTRHITNSYTTSDCTGTPYIEARDMVTSNNSPLFEVGTRVDDPSGLSGAVVLAFPSPPWQVRNIRSVKRAAQPCIQNFYPMLSGVRENRRLNFVPPFTAR